MNFNATLIGQSIAFAVFVWFCVKYIWPVIIKALDDRQAKIADGLAAAEKGQHELKLAEKRAIEILRESKEKYQEFIVQGQKHRDEMIEEAKENARQEGERMLNAAKDSITQERQRAKEELREKVSMLAITGAEQILMREVDQTAHDNLLRKIGDDL